MSDLVERLRAWHTPNETITGDVQLYLDAADRIEALEQDIADRESLLLAAGKRLAECDAAMVAAHTLLKRFEAALREITEGSFVTDTAYDAIRIARAALAPEQDKSRSDWPKDGFINDYD